jgi:hypothetical protein
VTSSVHPQILCSTVIAGSSALQLKSHLVHAAPYQDFFLLIIEKQRFSKMMVSARNSRYQVMLRD